LICGYLGVFQRAGVVLTWFGFHSGDRGADSAQRSTPQKPDDLITFPGCD